MFSLHISVDIIEIIAMIRLDIDGLMATIALVIVDS